MLARISRTFQTTDTIGALWCSLMHDSPRWPIHGHYECSVCGRQHRVPWAEAESTPTAGVRHAPLPSLRSATLPVLLLMALVAWPSRGEEGLTAGASPAAVLERFVATQREADVWPLETIEIEASLPNLKKTGRLRAIRRLFPIGQPDYTVLEIAGDPTVKSQVIVRYIAADERASKLPVSSVALTPTNYNIHYAGTVRLGSRFAYIYRVVPRKKREGLINGVLWLDSETAFAIRESGYLAKSPSIFLKRINLTRENDVRDGTIRARITHVSVEARLVGTAQLVIIERPSNEELTTRAAVEQGQ